MGLLEDGGVSGQAAAREVLGERRVKLLADPLKATADGVVTMDL